MQVTRAGGPPRLRLQTNAPVEMCSGRAKIESKPTRRRRRERHQLRNVRNELILRLVEGQAPDLFPPDDGILRRVDEIGFVFRITGDRVRAIIRQARRVRELVARVAMRA